MPLLLVLSYFLLEGYSLAQFWKHFGFVNLLFALLAGAVFGFGVLRSQGRYMLTKMQQNLVRGLTPPDEILHGILIFVAGVLFVIPGFASDLLALFLLVPGPRHLTVAVFKRRFANLAKTGGFRVFTYGGGFGSGPKGTSTGATNDDGWTRDVSPRVIDVKPIAVETHEKKESQDH